MWNEAYSLHSASWSKFSGVLKYMKSAEGIISRLNLKPYPEGGFYRQVYKDVNEISLPDGRTRKFLTHIYYLLKDEQFSRFHKVPQPEIWHFYAGNRLRVYSVSDDMASLKYTDLGVNDNYYHAVESNCWQAASLLSGGFALVGCTVAPGFEFEDFSFLKDSGDIERKFISLYPHLSYLV